MLPSSCVQVFLGFLVLVFGVCSSEGGTDASVLYNTTSDTYYLKDGLDKENGVAYGSFDDALQINGWGVFKVQTNAKFSDHQQMFAAGYLEGALTSDRIYENYYNTYQFYFSSSPPSVELKEFLAKQDEWVRSNTHGESLSPYWTQMSLTMRQFDGLRVGYHDHGSKALDLFAFQLVNAAGDFLDLIPAVNEEQRIDYSSLSPDEVYRTVSSKGHCSAFVKVPGDFSNLMIAHSTWFTYGGMNRIFKHYYFDLHASFIAAKKVSFSSYPGALVSIDDFYIMDSGLAMLQTTNSIFNHQLYEKVHPHSLFAWQRVKLANTLAHGGKEWADYFAQHNSGTYNNQYMIIDYKKFKVNQTLLPDLLWVVEQIPGLVERADVTPQLERGYWPSYNVPYFEQIYNQSGYPEFVAEHGIQYSYQMAPRAQIFRRDQSLVTDIPSLKHLMRYNDYKNDPYSHGNPGNAICSRFDLEPTHPSAAGCTDTKVSDLSLFTRMVVDAINGPTTQNDLPPFKWIQEFDGTAHMGQPLEFDFDFLRMDPQWA